MCETPKPHHHLLVTQVELQSELRHDVFVTFLHHFSNGLGQFHQYGGANCGFGVAFTPGVPLGSQDHITICRSKITHLDKEINVTTHRVTKMNCTRISESFDDAKNIVDLLVDQHVVYLHSNVLLTSQPVSQGGQAPFKITAGSWFRTINIPKKGRGEDS